MRVRRYIDGVSATSLITDPRCMDDWMSTCTLVFEDKASANQQVLALHGDERTEDGLILPPFNYCNFLKEETKDWGSGLLLSCTSTNALSPWNGLVTVPGDAAWKSASISTAAYASGYSVAGTDGKPTGPVDASGKLWYETDFSPPTTPGSAGLVAWGATQVATSDFYCKSAPCSGAEKLWAFGCEDHGFFRLTVGEAPPLPVVRPVYGRVTCTFTVDNVVDAVVINGVDVTSTVTPANCLDNWRKDCTVEFDDMCVACCCGPTPCAFARSLRLWWRPCFLFVGSLVALSPRPITANLGLFHATLNDCALVRGVRGCVRRYDVTSPLSTETIAVAGHETHATGCKNSGLALSCTSTSPGSPWAGFTSQTATWTADSNSGTFATAAADWCARH